MWNNNMKLNGEGGDGGGSFSLSVLIYSSLSLLRSVATDLCDESCSHTVTSTTLQSIPQSPEERCREQNITSRQSAQTQTRRETTHIIQYYRSGSAVDLSLPSSLDTVESQSIRVESAIGGMSFC